MWGCCCNKQAGVWGGEGKGGGHYFQAGGLRQLKLWGQGRALMRQHKGQDVANNRIGSRSLSVWLFSCLRAFDSVPPFF